MAVVATCPALQFEQPPDEFRFVVGLTERLVGSVEIEVQNSGVKVHAILVRSRYCVAETLRIDSTLRNHLSRHGQGVFRSVARTAIHSHPGRSHHLVRSLPR